MSEDPEARDQSEQIATLIAKVRAGELSKRRLELAGYLGFTEAEREWEVHGGYIHDYPTKGMISGFPPGVVLPPKISIRLDVFNGQREYFARELDIWFGGIVRFGREPLVLATIGVVRAALERLEYRQPGFVRALDYAEGLTARPWPWGATSDPLPRAEIDNELQDTLEGLFALGETKAGLVTISRETAHTLDSAVFLVFNVIELARTAATEDNPDASWTTITAGSIVGRTRDVLGDQQEIRRVIRRTLLPWILRWDAAKL